MILHRSNVLLAVCLVFSTPAVFGLPCSGTPSNCHAISPVATDSWCCANCDAGNCPSTMCRCGPAPAPSPPGPAPAPPSPGPPSANYSQLILAYFTGVALDTAAQGAAGINALSLAFFSPAAMLSANCTFVTTSESPCLQPASGAGGQLGLPWVVSTINAAARGLAAHAQGARPTIFISFGGQTDGGAGWDRALGSDAATAATFGANAAALVRAVSASVGGVVHVGVDLDAEGAKAGLVHLPTFLQAFRAAAPFEEHPVMLCTLSGLADPGSEDHFKLALVEQCGPATKGLNYLNMMVNNVDSSCDTMAAFWRDPALDFLPPSAKVLGCWGINNAAWMLHGPGCAAADDGELAGGLFPWAREHGAGLGVWEWWSGDTTPLGKVVEQVAQMASSVAATTHRSILGDPGMAWGTAPSGSAALAAPRMQLFFYDLCSKAGYSNMSVVPSPSDTCTSTPGAIIGFGAVKTVHTTNCCAACLAEPWCLAWTLSDGNVCTLKDNALPQPARQPLRPGEFTPRPGNCGGTSFEPAAQCNTSAGSSGAIQAREHGIESFEACAEFCAYCEECSFVSFSIGTGNGTHKDHDDCSWYSECNLSALAHDGANYSSAAVHSKTNSSAKNISIVSGVRVVKGKQLLPSPRYANCVVDGTQTITPADNARVGAAGVDDEWFAVEKEHALAEKCRVGSPVDVAAAAAAATAAPTESFFWTVMSQNGNAQSSIGMTEDCLPYCYISAGAHTGYPPAVNASAARCERASSSSNSKSKRPLGFNSLPMNQAKVMVDFTDPSDPFLRGSFNWTFELELDLAVPESEFPKNASLGIWSWERMPSGSGATTTAVTTTPTARGQGITRLYQRVSQRYPWICTYFGADVSRGVKANQAYDGRGMMTEPPIVGTDAIVRFFLNITKDEISGGGGVGSWYMLNMESCWDQITGKNCRPYGDTNRNVHQQVLLDFGGSDGCTKTDIGSCPPFHRAVDGTLIPRTDAKQFPYDAYKYYCCPCTACMRCHNLSLNCCDPFSNSNAQSIYKISPSKTWAAYGFPRNATDGFVGDPKMHELHVGKLWEQIWFPCPATEPVELITFNIGPETGYGRANGTHDTEWFVSDFDVLVPMHH